MYLAAIPAQDKFISPNEIIGTNDFWFQDSKIYLRVLGNRGRN